MSAPLSLRDRLALERTRLANERTALAYVRTAFALVAGALTVLHIYAGTVSDAAALILGVLGMVALGVGGLRYRAAARLIQRDLDLPDA